MSDTELRTAIAREIDSQWIGLRGADVYACVDRILALLAAPADGLVTMLTDGLRKIADKCKETLEMMRRHGWKYEDSDDLEQKMTFSVYTDLAEVCREADALLVELGARP